MMGQDALGVVGLALFGIMGGLIGIIYGNLKERISTLEKRLEVKTDDLTRDIRHRVENLSTKQLEIMQTLNQKQGIDLDDVQRNLKELVSLLVRTGSHEVLKRRGIEE